MEGLIALALVLGAYGLGTVTKAPRLVEKGPSAEVESVPITPAAPSEPPQPCRYFVGSLPQRDLTVPRESPVVGPEGVDEDRVTDSGDE
jgi:hypothetical protein